MFKTIISHRQLLWNFVSSDLKGRYAGSFMGIFWNIINPLITLGVYTFVFSYVLKSKLPAGAGTSNFAVFLFCGLVPWIAVSEAVQRSTTVILDNGSLVKKVKFPSEILVLYIAISAFIHELLALALFFLLLIAIGAAPGLKAVYLPLVFVGQLVFTVGLSLLLASLNVYIRDIAHLMGAVIMVWFFFTPIVYPLQAIPSGMMRYMGFNPMAQLVETYRDLLLRGQFHSLAGMAYFAAVSIGLFLLGSYVFGRAKKDFADLI